MLKQIHQLAKLQDAANTTRDWREIITFCGENSVERSSAQKKLMGAISLLLRLAELAPEHAVLDLDWFDQTFPRAPKIPLPVKLKTYKDARHRVRPAIRRLTVGTKRSKADSWNSLCKLIHEFLGGKRGADLSMIPLSSTLAKAARVRALQPSGLTQDVLVEMHEAMATSSERLSIRNASRLLSNMQACFPEVAARLPHLIHPVLPEAAPRYRVPFQLEHEINALEEAAAHKEYIATVDESETVADGTRIGMRTSLKALVDGLIRSGHLDPEADTFRHLLVDETILAAALKIQAERVKAGEIVPRHAATLVRRLPIIFDRNGISSINLRGLIAKTPEFKMPRSEETMTAKTKKFCQSLIEDRDHRQRFLCAHKMLRQKAIGVLESVCKRTKKLSPAQRQQVIRMGTVALFCAIQTGGAPVRVRNMLGMRYGTPDAWLNPTAKGFRATIPAGHVKNSRKITFTVMRGPNAFAETISWYLEVVRPLILKETDGKSDWLVPMLSNPSRHCCYETFLNWFERLMRDEIELPCTPHNFRHGQASLLYHKHPEHIDTIAQRLGNSRRTVLKHYAWVHEEQAMIEGQKLLTGLIEEAA
jgi:hypothetical protein